VKRALVYLVCFLAISLAATLMPSRYLPLTAMGLDVESLHRVTFEGNPVIEFYDITGTTNQDLMDAMDKKRETLKGFAITEYNVVYDVKDSDPTSPQCKIVSWKVEPKIKVVLPRWTNPGDAPLGLVIFWKFYFQEIVRHEAGHVRIVLEGAAAVDEVIAGSNCENVAKAAEAEIARIYDRQLVYEAEEGMIAVK
jgi:predicted secreted Zn-dependent protease